MNIVELLCFLCSSAHGSLMRPNSQIELIGISEVLFHLFPELCGEQCMTFMGISTARGHVRYDCHPHFTYEMLTQILGFRFLKYHPMPSPSTRASYKDNLQILSKPSSQQVYRIGRASERCTLVKYHYPGWQPWMMGTGKYNPTQWQSCRADHRQPWF